MIIICFNYSATQILISSHWHRKKIRSPTDENRGSIIHLYISTQATAVRQR